MPNSKESRAWAHRQERKALFKAIKKHKGNLRKTAFALGMPYSTINYKIRILDLKDAAADLRRANRKGSGGAALKAPVRLVETPVEKFKLFISVLEAD